MGGYCLTRASANIPKWDHSISHSAITPFEIPVAESNGTNSGKYQQQFACPVKQSHLRFSRSQYGPESLFLAIEPIAWRSVPPCGGIPNCETRLPSEDSNKESYKPNKESYKHSNTYNYNLGVPMF